MKTYTSTGSLVLAAALFAGTIVSMHAQNPSIRVWDQNFRGAAENMAELCRPTEGTASPTRN
jgi:hypothetical protein